MHRHASLPLLALATLSAGCSTDAPSIATPELARRVSSTPVRKLDFLFVSDASGVDQIYRYTAGHVTRLTFSGLTDTDPQSAAGRLVFTSYRDGDAEIYIGTLDATTVKRLTTSPGLDDEPALSPSGDSIVFVSARNGVPRLWMMDSTGAQQAPLATGGPDFTPEVAPAWSPAGDQIAFTSTRTGISQVFIVPATGGDAVQLTHESGGAFDPAWSTDGTQIYYTAANGTPDLRVVTLATGAVSDYERGSGRMPPSYSEAACNATLCLAVKTAAGSTNGNIVAINAPNAKPKRVVATKANEHAPAFVVQ